MLKTAKHRPRFTVPKVSIAKSRSRTIHFEFSRTTLPAWRNGRRDRLKICYPEGCGGSSPSAGTTLKNREKSRFFRIQGPSPVEPAPSLAESNNESNNLSGDVRRRPPRSEAAWNQGVTVPVDARGDQMPVVRFSTEKLPHLLLALSESESSLIIQWVPPWGRLRAPMVRTSKAKPHHS